MSIPLREKIKDRMSLLDIQPKRSLGQNFLVSDDVVEKIIDAAEPETFDKVIEIGPGLGALTDLIFERNKNLTLFELDKKFSEFWRNQNKNVIEGDALKYDWKNFSWENQKNLLISNLPYQISSRLVVELSFHNPSFDRMVLMFQKEVGQRLVAKSGSGDYGLLTVIAQVFWDINFLLEAGAVDFMPKPNVASRVLVFNRKQVREDLYSKSFLNFVKQSFSQRRKKLISQITAYGSKEELAKILEKMSLNSDVRAEKLSPEQFIELYLSLKK